MAPDEGPTTGMTEMLAQANWFAIQAKPHREDLAAASLDALDLEVFLPKITREQFVAGIARVISKPLFVGYFFARFCPLVSMDAIRYARGVLRVVGTSHYPIPLEREVVSGIQERVQADGFIRLEASALRPGQRVTVEEGPFEGLMGQVEREWNDGKRVAILLEAVSKARILIERRCLALAAGL